MRLGTSVPKQEAPNPIYGKVNDMVCTLVKAKENLLASSKSIGFNEPI